MQTVRQNITNLQLTILYFMHLISLYYPMYLLLTFDDPIHQC